LITTHVSAKPEELKHKLATLMVDVRYNALRLLTCISGRMLLLNANAIVARLPMDLKDTSALVPSNE
jgi:hypothetical protein